MGDQVTGDIEPCCGNCPYRKVGDDGTSICIEGPPKEFALPMPITALPREQQLRLPPDAVKAGVIMTFQSRFPHVLVTWVCAQHPDFSNEEEGTLN